MDVLFAEPEKIITDIAAVHAVILSSQLKEMLLNVNSPALFQGTSRPIKLVYHPREPFFVIKQASPSGNILSHFSVPVLYQEQDR